MDISPRQADEIQEIEKQLGQNALGPKVLSQKEETNRSMLMNLLAVLGISITTAAAVILLMLFPFAKKKLPPTPTITTSTVQVASSPTIIVQSEYINPFSSTAQYDNPFTASQNPFSTQ